MWDNWVLDVTNGHEPMSFCPIEDDGAVVTGMTMLSGACPGRFVGVIHMAGKAAVDAWLLEHSAIADQLAAANTSLCDPRPDISRS